MYETIKKDLWLVSMAGGTDVCTAFIGGNPLLPVYQGEIQCRALGCNMEAWSEDGKPLINEVGEMVITTPMPSMPIYFWNDPSGEKYYNSYFDYFQNTKISINSIPEGEAWRHGDWLLLTERQTLIILGRSDATLNRQGVRIGTSEIYRAMDTVRELKDCVIINLERPDGTDFMPLYVVLNEGVILDAALKNKINQTLRQTYSPRHVPDAIFVVPDIPYTISGKKMETPIKKILLGKPLAQAVNIGSVRNPESIDWFIAYQKELIL
jgi:acetoacetyl-CoA synthetase